MAVTQIRLDHGRVAGRGRQQVVRNGHHPLRTLVTGIGPVTVAQPRVLDWRIVGIATAAVPPSPLHVAVGTTDPSFNVVPPSRGGPPVN